MTGNTDHVHATCIVMRGLTQSNHASCTDLAMADAMRCVSFAF